MDDIMKEVQTGRQYVAVLFKKGSVEPDSTQAQALQIEHLKFLFNLRNTGKISVFGPFLNHSNLVGLAIFNTSNLIEVKSIMDAEPYVKKNMMTYEMINWFGLPGATLPK